VSYLKKFKSYLSHKFRPSFKAIYGKLKRFPKLARYLHKIHNQFFGSSEFIFPARKLTAITPDEELILSGKVPNLVILDAQCLQSGSFSRGIGRYSRTLTNWLVQQNPDVNFLLYFNRLELDRGPEVVIANFPNNLKNLKFFQSRIALNSPHAKIKDYATAMSEEITSMNPRSVISLSVMESPTTVIPMSVQTFPNSAAIFYDVIPLQFPDSFFKTPMDRKTYDNNVDHLLKHKYILSISDTSKKNLLKFFPDQQNITSIFGAGFPQHAGTPRSNLEQRAGIIIVGSDSPHKNIDTAITAYSTLPLRLRTQHPLHIVGVAESGARARLDRYAKGTGCEIRTYEHLADDELQILYGKVRLAVAPAWEEGLGMPVFESWQQGSVCIGSKETALAEILGSNYVCFDCRDSGSIAEKMLFFLSNDEGWLAERERIEARSLQFSWKRTADLVANVIGIKNE
jgi:glycosyltransferase involved in cell wall biosynthesis